MESKKKNNEYGLLMNKCTTYVLIEDKTKEFRGINFFLDVDFFGFWFCTLKQAGVNNNKLE